jgi:uncharacterized protein YcbK (DUF882 family)
MGDLSKNFSRSEFECSDKCGFDTVDIILLNWMQIIRSHFDTPVIVHCGCRCKKQNESISGAENSQHLKGKACDFHMQGLTTPLEIRRIYNWIDENICPDSGGLGLYDWGIHLDSRSKKARWDMSN